MHPELAVGSNGYLDALKSLLTNPPAEVIERGHQLLNAPHLFGVEIGFNLPAFIIALIITAILVIGIQRAQSSMPRL